MELVFLTVKQLWRGFLKLDSRTEFNFTKVAERNDIIKPNSTVNNIKIKRSKTPKAENTITVFRYSERHALFAYTTHTNLFAHLARGRTGN